MSAIIVRVNPPQILMHWIEITIIWACLRGFWQSEIQTSLLSYRDYPEDLKFHSKVGPSSQVILYWPSSRSLDIIHKWFCIGPVTGLWTKFRSDFVLAQLQAFNQVQKWFCIGPVTGCWTKLTSDFVLAQLQAVGPSSQVILYWSSCRSLDWVHKWFCISPVVDLWK